MKHAILATDPRIEVWCADPEAVRASLDRTTVHELRERLQRAEMLAALAKRLRGQYGNAK